MIAPRDPTSHPHGESARDLLDAARAEVFSGWTGRQTRMGQLGAQALALAREAGDTLTEAQAQFYALHHRASLMPKDEALATLGQAQQRCNELGHPDDGRVLEITRGFVHYLHREYLQAIGVFTRLDQLPPSRLPPLARAMLLHYLAVACKFCGRFDEVVFHRQRALDAARAAQHRFAQAAMLCNLANHHIHVALAPEGSLPLLQLARELLGQVPVTPLWMNVTSSQVQALDMLGEHEQAHRALFEALARPGAFELARDTATTTVLALIGVGRLDEAEAWLGPPPDVGETEPNWHRLLTYRTAKLRLLCAQHRFAQARELATEQLSSTAPFVLDPLAQVQLCDALREACQGLGDHQGAADAALAASRACLPALRTSARARYLVLQLGGEETGAQLSATHQRRLDLIDSEILAKQAALDTGIDESAPPAALSMPRFVAHLSHELRNPIGNVLGMTSLLFRTDLSEQQRRYVQTTQDTAQTLLAMVNDVLDLARLEQGQFSIQSQAFDPRAWLQRCLAPYADVAQAKGLRWHTELDADLPLQVEGDAARLSQVASNLVGNAVKFTEAGHVAVRLMHAPASESAKRLLRFEVEDTGIGIHDHAMPGLFQEFAQADASIAQRFGGTGLGLAVSRQLIERMGGRMGAHSRIGHGSRFWFELPLHASPRHHATND